MKGYDKITDPVATGRKVSVYGKTGQQIIKNYLGEQSGGDATPHMGARAARRTQNITQEIRDADDAQLATASGRGITVRGRPAAAHDHVAQAVQDVAGDHTTLVSSVELTLVGPCNRNKLTPESKRHSP